MSKTPAKAAGKAPTPNKIARRPFVAELMGLRKGALVVPGLGSPCWDISAAGDSTDFLYNWGGMGLAVPTALGLALAQPNRRVLAITGDGEMMMGIGSLGVVADQAPKNLGILVLDNEHFSETGQIKELANLLFERPGPTFAVAKIAITEDPWSLPEKDGAVIAHRFKAALGLAKA